MIRVDWYFNTGSASHSSDYDAPLEAFEACVMTGMDAHVYPAGTANGLYNWQSGRDHKLEAFEAKLANIAQYQRLDQWKERASISPIQESPC